MVRIVKTEFYKLKRYHILWAGVALMLLSVLLTLFTSMANDGSVWDFTYLTEQVIKNNMSMIFPMCISLTAGYMISREQTDDTLKNILTVPVSFKRLLTGKLIVCGVLSIAFGAVFFAFFFACFCSFSFMQRTNTTEIATTTVRLQIQVMMFQLTAVS